MRTPQNTLVAVLSGALGGAVGMVLGGMGGFAVKLRALRQRIDGHDDELESFNRRVSKREGVAGRAKQEQTNERLEAEREKILARLVDGSGPTNGAPKPSNDQQLLGWVNSIFGAPSGPRGEES